MVGLAFLIDLSRLHRSSRQLKQFHLVPQELLNRNVSIAHNHRFCLRILRQKLSHAALGYAPAFNLDCRKSAIAAPRHKIHFEIAFTPPVQLKTLRLSARDKPCAHRRFNQMPPQSRVSQQVTRPTPHREHQRGIMHEQSRRACPRPSAGQSVPKPKRLRAGVAGSSVR